MQPLTNEQIAFAQTLSLKQRGVLNALAMFDFYMSASERADPELYDLIRHRFAHAFSHSKSDGLFSWGLTEAGHEVVRQIKADAL